ncbi:protein phosphatase 2C domain-containing protein [Ditylenchus destructor]|nr:protein phosphatase 2C domain-containing protein [Ditylenchus destructor]
MRESDKKKENDESSWNNPIFVSLESKHETLNEKQNSNEQNSTDSKNYWIHASDKNAHVFLLLNSFGPCEVVSQCISKCLVQKLLNSDELKNIAKILKKDSPSRTKGIDNRVYDLLKNVFRTADSETYDEALSSCLDGGTSLEAHMNSGCTAVLALIIDKRLYLSYCGNSVAILGKNFDEVLTIIQLAYPPHEDPNATPSEDVTDFIYTLPSRGFGDYGRKTDVNADPNTTFSSEPNVVGAIEIDRTVRFMLMVPAVTLKVIQKLYPDAHVAISDLVINALSDHSRSTNDALKEVLEKIDKEFHNKFGTEFNSSAHKLELGLAYINMGNDFPPIDSPGENGEEPSTDMTIEGSDQGVDSPSNNSDSPSQEDSVPVPSYVDWSEWYTHEQRETVLAKIESIKQHNRDRNTLNRIEED